MAGLDEDEFREAWEHVNDLFDTVVKGGDAEMDLPEFTGVDMLAAFDSDVKSVALNANQLDDTLAVVEIVSEELDDGGETAPTEKSVSPVEQEIAGSEHEIAESEQDFPVVSVCPVEAISPVESVSPALKPASEMLTVPRSHPSQSQGSDSYAGLSAVEVARRKAQNMAMESIGEKRRNSSEDEGPAKRSRGTAESPEKIHQKRYQRRLQKNRDTAYISRIRRRAYTNLLEEALSSNETEKKQLASVIDSLKTEISTLKAELRGLYASKLTSPFAMSGIMMPQQSVNMSDVSDNSSNGEAKPMFEFLQDIFKPIGNDSAPQTIPKPVRRPPRTNRKAARGSVMLMFSLLFVIAVPGLCWGPTLSEVASFAAAPSVPDAPATVWGEDALHSYDSLDSHVTVDASYTGSTYTGSKSLPPQEKCKLPGFANTVECLQQDLDFSQVGFGASFGGGGIIAQ